MFVFEQFERKQSVSIDIKTVFKHPNEMVGSEEKIDPRRVDFCLWIVHSIKMNFLTAYGCLCNFSIEALIL